MPATTEPDSTSASAASSKQVGHYQVIAKIGEGGMGEVYRARDTRLNREVALKVLPRAFADDPMRMARFEREAQLLASLNHPKIAAIYGLEESGAARALVMELVEGPTLAERIGRAPASAKPRAGSASPAQASAGAGSGAKGSARSGGSGRASKNAIPMDEALPIAQQIAEALEYAHERGVIHRDLKPANIKVTADGDVKVLDFGLAKAMGPEDASDDMANSPTLSLAMTQAGFIIGTAAYMAPEQAKAKPVDRRADIWAFGCVLYEMLAGRKAFEGETISDVLAAVIKSEPDWSALPIETPAPIQRLIRRCLQKDPRQRLQAIGDARIAIEETLSDAPSIFGTASQAEEGSGGLDRARRSPLRRGLPWGVAAACFLVGAFLAFVYFRPGSTPAPTTRSLIAAPEKGRFEFLASPISGGPVLSLDGTRLVFPAYGASGDEALWVRPLNSLAAQQLQGTEGASFPFWAPDSRQIGFFKGGKLEKIDVTGGPPVLICDAANARGGTWNQDGIIVFAPETLGGLSSVPAAGGTPTTIISRPQKASGPFSDRWPDFLPDGKHYLYLSGDLNSPGTAQLGIYVRALGSKEAKFLFQADSDALYAAPGYLLFLRGDTLMAQRFDAGSLKLKGDAFPVAEHVPSPRQFRLGIFGVSQTGFLVYLTGESGSGDGQLVWVDATGKEIGKAGVADGAFPRLSPDGKTLAYVSAPPGQLSDIWLMDIARGVETRFTFGPGLTTVPVWSPDGSRIAYSSGTPNPMEILVKDASGAGSAGLLFKSETNLVPTDWSRDGRYILFARLNTEGRSNRDIWVLPLFGDRKPFPYLATQFDEGRAVFSPDGRWVAYLSDESGKIEVYVSTFPAGGGKWQVSQGGGQEPEWGRDGRNLYYLASGGKMMEASIAEKGPAVEIGAPHELFALTAGTVNGAGYAVAPDGKRFLMVEPAQGESQPLTLVTNWSAGLEK